MFWANGCLVGLFAHAAGALLSCEHCWCVLEFVCVSTDSCVEAIERYIEFCISGIQKKHLL